MCGIVGFLKLKNTINNGFDKSALVNMTKAISHRGPDNNDIWHEENIYLGHARLSILDISSKGNQPMISKSKRFVITFNGEIYNFKELKSKLNYTINWFGNSDTEVFLECIEAWGIDKTLRLSRGMFAFAIWDRLKKTLTLARDRVGEKPLYYGFLNGQFVFSSELKSIKILKNVGLEKNLNAMNLMVKFGYVPSPLSIYKNIFKLLPGSIIEISNKTKSIENFLWWKNNFKNGSSENPIEFEQELHGILRMAVKEQMLSDVPLGAFLSGGIDSSLIVSLMQEQSLKKIKTFTIGFTETEFNEAKYAKKVSNILGTDHNEFYFSPKDVINLIPKIPFIYDEPFADSSQIPTMLISQLSRKHVKVCLSGDGGDELFGGYNRYLWSNSIIKNFEKIPIKYRNFLSFCCKGCSEDTLTKTFNLFSKFIPENYRFNNFGDKLHKFCELIKFSSKEDLYLKMISQWQEELSQSQSGEINKILDRVHRWDNNMTDIENMMKTDLSMYLPDDILVKIDRAAMSYGLETRVPFLDKRVIEAAWKIPIEEKIKNKIGKIPLRNILKKYIPENLVERPKQGFGVPINSWLRGPLKEWANDLLDEKKLNNDLFIDKKIITKKWQEHLSGRKNWHYPIWNILVLQSWIEVNS